MESNLNRKQKIDLIMAISQGRKSISELASVKAPQIWEDTATPGQYLEAVSKRTFNYEEMKKHQANIGKNGVIVSWCEVD
jgi:hypothetical protein